MRDGGTQADRFRETLPAPFEWDLKRLAASLVVAARDNRFDQAAQRAAARSAASAYAAVTANFFAPEAKPSSASCSTIAQTVIPAALSASSSSGNWASRSSGIPTLDL